MAVFTVQIEHTVNDASSEDHARENLRRYSGRCPPRVRVTRTGPDPEPDDAAVTEPAGTAEPRMIYYVFTRYYRVSATSPAEAEAKVKQDPDVYFNGENVRTRWGPT
jgi:hypothetical protein